MAENKNNLNIPAEKFVFVNEGERLRDKKFDDKPIGYLKDAWIRFRKSKASDSRWACHRTSCHAGARPR